MKIFALGLCTRKIQTLFVSALVLTLLLTIFSPPVKANENEGSVNDSGTSSRIKIISDILTESGYRDVAPGEWGDWGAMWNRIYSAANWAPEATATVNDVAYGKTFYTNGNRVRQTGKGINQSAPYTINIPGDNSKISVLYRTAKGKGFGSEAATNLGNWGAMWNRIYSASVWTPSDANAIPSDVALGKTFYAGNNRVLQTGTYVDNGNFTGVDTTPPTVNAGATQHSYTNVVRTYIASAADNESGIASMQWNKQAGPGTVTFGSPSSLITTVKANAVGTLTLRLSVTDIAGNVGTGDTEFIVHKTADYNNDSVVDEIDFSYLALNWNSTDLMADFNGDGFVDEIDFSLLALNWTF